MKQIEDLFSFLHRLSGPNGVIRQSEFFLYTEKDKEAVAKCLEKGYRYPEITGWIRANKEDLQLVRDFGLKETGMLTSISDYHIFYKFKKTRSQVFKEYIKMVEAALESGIVPRCHFEDVTRADIHGFCVPFAQALMALSEEAKIPVKIRLCDTLGVGVTYPGAALPRSIGKIIRAMIDDAGVPSEYLEWHGHNDFYRGVVGSGQRVALRLHLRKRHAPGHRGTDGQYAHRGPPDGVHLAHRGRQRGGHEGDHGGAELLRERGGACTSRGTSPSSAPTSTPPRRASISTALPKNEEIYTAFDTKRILDRPIAVNITDKSGLAGIAHWINAHFALIGRGRDREEQPRRGEDQQAHPEGIRGREGDGHIRRGDGAPRAQVSPLGLPVGVRRAEEEGLRHGRPPDRALHRGGRHQEHGAGAAGRGAERLVADYPFIQFAYVVNVEGVKVTRNITQAVDRAKYAKIDLHEDFSDRDWFIRAVEIG